MQQIHSPSAVCKFDVSISLNLHLENSLAFRMTIENPRQAIINSMQLSIKQVETFNGKTFPRELPIFDKKFSSRSDSLHPSAQEKIRTITKDGVFAEFGGHCRLPNNKRMRPSTSISNTPLVLQHAVVLRCVYILSDEGQMRVLYVAKPVHVGSVCLIIRVLSTNPLIVPPDRF